MFYAEVKNKGEKKILYSIKQKNLISMEDTLLREWSADDEIIGFDFSDDFLITYLKEDELFLEDLKGKVIYHSDLDFVEGKKCHVEFSYYNLIDEKLVFYDSLVIHCEGSNSIHELGFDDFTWTESEYWATEGPLPGELEHYIEEAEKRLGLKKLGYNIEITFIQF